MYASTLHNPLIKFEITRLWQALSLAVQFQLFPPEKRQSSNLVVTLFALNERDFLKYFSVNSLTGCVGRVATLARFSFWWRMISHAQSFEPKLFAWPGVFAKSCALTSVTFYPQLSWWFPFSAFSGTFANTSPQLLNDTVWWQSWSGLRKSLWGRYSVDTFSRFSVGQQHQNGFWQRRRVSERRAEAHQTGGSSRASERRHRIANAQWWGM